MRTATYQTRAWATRGALTVLLTLTVACFAWRGPIRAVAGGGSGDLTVGYSAARAWIAGDDPYDPVILRGHLARAGGVAQATEASMNFMRNIYLPVTIPMFVPVALLPWPVARISWALINVAGLVVIVVRVLRLAEVPVCSYRGTGLIVLAMLFAPVQTAIGTGQSSIVSVMLLILASGKEQAGRPWWAGLLYGLATAMKVQIGLPFVAYLLWRRRWIAASGAGIVLLVLTSVSLLRMEVGGIDWLASRQANVQQTMSSGGYNDAISGSPGRYTLINLQYLVHDFTDSRPVANGVTLAVVGALGLLMVVRLRGRDPEHELLAFSTVAVLTLLVTYHRTYDAVLMLIPAAWALRGLGTSTAAPGVRIRQAVLACCATFVFPGQVLFQYLGGRGAVPGWVAGSTMWQATVMCQHVWAILICAGLLVRGAWQEER